MQRKYMAILAVIIVLMGIFAVNGYAAVRRETVTISREEYERLLRFSKLDEILKWVEQLYYQEPDIDAMLEMAARGLMAGLGDNYSYYYTEDEWASMWEKDEGEYAGIGLNLLGDYSTGIVTIIRVFKDTPSKDAGVLRGDILVRVEDLEVNVYSMQEAVDIMRGQVGEEVEIEVLRGNEFITFHIPRQDIHVNQIESTMLDDQVGLITLYQFASESQQEFTEAFNKLKAEGAQSLIIDLRDNPGGWVDAAVTVADLFLDETYLIYVEDRYGYQYKNWYVTTDGKDDIPLVIIINENSASASEILAGGLQDLGRATVVGTLSYGKGIMQNVIGLGENSTDGIQVTCAEYFLHSGKKVHKVGITPDVISEMPEEMKSKYFEHGDLSDPQLYDAYQEALKLIK